MGQGTRFLLAMLTLGIAVFVLAPSAQRFLPTPEPQAAPNESGMLVVDLVPGTTDAQLEELSSRVGATLERVGQARWSRSLAHGEVADLQAAIAAIEGHTAVVVAEPEVTLRLVAYPNDPLFDQQWHLPAMGAPAGWDASPRGRGVTVAVIDTGVAPVSDLSPGRLREGKSKVPDVKSPVDDNGHGTHVAGTIAQTTHNGIGGAGVAPKSRILPVKVLSEHGVGTSQWIAAGIDYASKQGADVINLSLGGAYSRVVHKAVKRARDRGAVVVAAVGNTGREGVAYPGGLKQTLGVAAVGPSGERAPYSSYGKGVDLAAPGGDKREPGGGILQQTVDRDGNEVFSELQGTSMAAPHVAGAAAVLRSKGVPPRAVEDLLLRTAQGSGSWNPELGHGALDLGSALSVWRERQPLVRFLLAAVIAAWVTGLGTSSLGARLGVTLIAGLTASGLFVLPWLGWDGAISGLLGRGWLLWPGQVVSPGWVDFPLWTSAIVPVVVAAVWGASPAWRPLAIGFGCGVGAHLLHGAAVGSLHPWWLGETLGKTWLTGNAALSVLAAAGVVGLDKLEQRKAHG